MPVKKTTHHAGHTTKHVGTTKHSKTSKHSPGKTHKKATAHKTAVHTKAKHPAHAKATGLALVPGDVACCAAEALAASLRLQGVPVRDRDVLDLFRLAGGDDERGVPIRDALEAASAFGLGGIRPVSFAAVDLADPWRPLDEGHRGVILGLDLPGPHAVLDDGSSWWSWGEPYDLSDFPGAVIQEAWAVTWAVAA